MNTRSKYLCSILLCLLGSYHPVAAQYAIVQDKTAAELSTAIQGSDITITSATLSCKDSMNGTFTADVLFGLDSGIVLNTNKVAKIFTTYDYDNKPDNAGHGMWSSNAYDSLFFDPMIKDWGFYQENRFYSASSCVLQLGIIPLRDELKFNYIFSDALMDHDSIAIDTIYAGKYLKCRYATVHTPVCACRPYGHILGFFLQGGTDYIDTTNIAVYDQVRNIPVNSYTLTVSNDFLEFYCPVSHFPLREVYWNGPYPQYMRYNTAGGYMPSFNYPGLTVPMEASAKVTPCEAYTLTIGISKIWGLCMDGLCFTGGALFLNNLRAEGLDCDGLASSPIAMPALDISAAPNPFKEYIHLVPQPGFQPNTNLQLLVTDITGRVVYQSTGNIAQLNQALYTVLRPLAHGIYLLHLQADNFQNQTFKIIKE